MLSGDMALYHNHAMPYDVNGDGVVTLHDAHALHREMLAAATLPLDLSPQLGRGAPLGPAPEGEGGTDAVFFDINGDNYLTPRDAELMVRGLNPEAHGGDAVHYDVTIYDSGSGIEYGVGRFDANPVTVQIDQGDEFELRVYVQDVRAGVDADDMGVRRAYVKAFGFDPLLADYTNPGSPVIDHGPEYNEPGFTNADFNADNIDYAGSAQTGSEAVPGADALGPDPFLLFSVPFTASTINTGTFTFETESPDLTAPLDQQFRVLLANDPTTVLDAGPDGDIFYDEIDVEIVNNPVEAIADPNESVPESSTNQTIDVLANDLYNGNPPTGQLTISDVTPLTTTNGSTIAIAGDELSLTYNPGNGFAGVEEFIYTITDGTFSDSALVTITVTPVNDGPITNPDTFNITENETLVITEAGSADSLLNNDFDPEGDPFFITDYDTTMQPPTGGLQGSLTEQSGPPAQYTWLYDPITALDYLDEGESFTDIWRYEAQDNQTPPALSTPQWTEVRIIVEGVNDGPQPGPAFTTPITLTTTDDNTIRTYDLTALQASLTDPEGHGILPLTLQGPFSDLQGALTIEGSTLTYDPDGSPDLDPMFDGTESQLDTFVLIATDDQGGITQIPFEITVTGADDPIEFTGPLTLTTFTDQPLDFNAITGAAEPPPNLADAFYDPDSDIVFLPDDTLTQGVIDVHGPGMFTYDPNGAFDDVVYPATGLDTFVLNAISDNNSNDVVSPTVEIILEQDVRLPVIEGIVFADTNGNGVQEPWENPIHGVEITIQGWDVTNTWVEHTVTTGPDGTYSFAESEIGFDLIIGDYMLIEHQPEYMLDGQDFINGAPSVYNDAFMITDADSVPGDFVFTELGLDPAYLSLAPYLTTTSQDGLFLAFDDDGDLAWSYGTELWEGYTVLTAGFSNDLGTLFVTVEDPGGGVHVLQIPTAENQQYCPYSMDGDTGVLRLNGPPTDFI